MISFLFARRRTTRNNISSQLSLWCFFQHQTQIFFILCFSPFCNISNRLTFEPNKPIHTNVSVQFGIDFSLHNRTEETDFRTNPTRIFDRFNSEMFWPNRINRNPNKPNRITRINRTPRTSFYSKIE